MRVSRRPLELPAGARVVELPAEGPMPGVGMLIGSEIVLAYCGVEDGFRYLIVGAQVRKDVGPSSVARVIADGLNDASCVLTPPTIFSRDDE